MPAKKVMVPPTGIKLKPSTEFGGIQVRDESTGDRYDKFHGSFSKAAKVPGSKGVPGAGHTVKTHRG